MDLVYLGFTAACFALTWGLVWLAASLGGTLWSVGPRNRLAELDFEFPLAGGDLRGLLAQEDTDGTLLDTPLVTAPPGPREGEQVGPYRLERLQRHARLIGGNGTAQQHQGSDKEAIDDKPANGRACPASFTGRVAVWLRPSPPGWKNACS